MRVPDRVRRYAAALACGLAACGGGTSGPDDRTPRAVEVVGVAEQQGTVALLVPAAPTLVVRDAAGRPVAGVQVTFTVTAGDGWVVARDVVTDAQGLAAATWYLGPRPGDNNLRAATAAGTVEFTARAARLQPGQLYFGANDYIELVPGGLPLIVTASHGGSLLPASIPDRTVGVTAADLNTADLAREIGSTFTASTGAAPWLIINRLHRRKLDANREIGEAAAGNAAAERAWREFHGFIAAAHAEVAERHGRGLLIDVHGHAHAIARLELGYLLSAADLARSDAELSQPAMVQKSAVRDIAESATRPFGELIRGPSSLGALFAAAGYRAVPGPAEPHPAGEEYFTGGYIVARHGSRDGGTISAVQIEAHFAGVRDTPASRTAFAAAVVAVADDYFDAWYGVPLTPQLVSAR